MQVPDAMNIIYTISKINTSLTRAVLNVTLKCVDVSLYVNAIRLNEERSGKWLQVRVK